MKLFFFSFLFISFQSFSQTTDSNYLSQKEVKKAVDQISKFIRKQSIVTDSLKWREIDREVEQISTTVKRRPGKDQQLFHKTIKKSRR